MECEALVEIGTIQLPESEIERQRVLWDKGVLAPKWADQFPELFKLDSEWARGPQPKGKDGGHGYGFWEFLAAIILHHATGYRSLWSRFPVESMEEKVEVVKQLGLLSILTDRGPKDLGTQVPDLLMYAEDFNMEHWFFCEVKGPTDRVSTTQCEKFEWLAAETGKPVRLLEFKVGPDLRLRG